MESKKLKKAKQQLAAAESNFKKTLFDGVQTLIGSLAKAREIAKKNGIESEWMDEVSKIAKTLDLRIEPLAIHVIVKIPGPRKTKPLSVVAKPKKAKRQPVILKL